MDNGRELIEALAQVSQEKGIDKEVIFEAIEASLVSACKRHFGPSANIRVLVDRETGEYIVLATKTVVEIVTDDLAEISLEDALKISPQYQLEDILEIRIKPGNFGRISAQTAKQVVVQKFREAEREILYNEFSGKEHSVLTGLVQRRDRRSVIVSIGRLEAFLPTAEQIPNEQYIFNERIRVYVLEVKQNSKGPTVTVSRTHPELVKYLFEQAIPEIEDGTVEIKAVSREPGARSKVAVHSKHPNIDAIGSCVGQNGQRVNMISAELSGERIDVIQWNEDPEKYIASALAPSKVVAVATNEADMVAHVVVPDSHLSLAIGLRGQNARLAARLTGWKIDIKSESQAEGTDFLIFPEQERKMEEAIGIETAYSVFYETEATEPQTETIEPTVEIEPTEELPAQEIATEQKTPAATDEYYDDEYYDDEYYDDEYYEDEYYDDEYYEEYETEPAPPSPTEGEVEK